MKIIEYEEFAEKVDEQIKPIVVERAKIFFESEVKKMRSFQKNYYFFLALGLALIFISVLVNIIAISNNGFVGWIVFVMMILFLFGFSFIVVANGNFRKAKEIANKLPSLIHEDELVKQAFCLDEKIEQINFEKNYDIASCTNISYASQAELKSAGIPYNAKIDHFYENYKFIVNDKYSDVIQFRKLKYHWIQPLTSTTKTVQYVDMYKDIFVLEYTIHENNIEEKRDVDYTLFYAWKSNIELESQEFNNKVKLNSSDQIKARMLFTPALQEFILKAKEKEIVTNYFVRKEKNKIRIVFAAPKNFLEVIKASPQNLDEYTSHLLLALKRDTYALLELLRFMVYHGKQDNFSY